jgi:2-aminoadipate transaminase
MNLEIRLDRTADAALYEQIAERVREAVRSGALAPGAKLPSTREVATRLRVHRRTAVQAFHLLESEGCVTSGVGQGTFVSERAGEILKRPRPAGEGDGADPALFSWDAAVRIRPSGHSEIWRYWAQGQKTSDVIRFTGATADPSFFPAEDLREIIDEVFERHGSSALDYGPAEGYLPLREWVAASLAGRGLKIDPDQVMIVSGSQQGLDLLSRLLLREGDLAVVEEPGYTNGFRLFQANGARVLGVPMDEGGLRVDVLRQICARQAPHLLYLMPIFQNPTGLTLDPERFQPLLETCARYRVPIIEDQFDADLYYEGEAPRPLKAADTRDQVLLLGSFSKILFPGLRLGWIAVPPPLVRPLRELKQMADFSSGLLAQYAMDLYCRRGLLDEHLKRVRAIYGARLRSMCAAMDAEFPPGTSWIRPRGGLTLWVALPQGVDALELHERARREGVDFSPGPFFFPQGGGSGYLRLSYIRETEERIGRGIAVLGRLIQSGSTRAEDAPAAGPFF